MVFPCSSGQLSANQVCFAARAASSWAIALS
jgi:hypothetical protein